MQTSLFSTYNTGENRVTASTLAVFERLPLEVVSTLLQKAGDVSDDLESVYFENQVVGPDSVPDAVIRGDFRWFFETKTTRGCYESEGHSRMQLRKHLRLLRSGANAMLFVLTPDLVEPTWIRERDFCAGDAQVSDRVVWISFRSLADTILERVSSSSVQSSEIERFLLRELAALYENEGLLSADDTVVVAAGKGAWREYQEASVYVCQPGRSFREGVNYWAFYSSGRIQPLVPKVVGGVYSSVLFSEETADSCDRCGDVEVAEAIRKLLQVGHRHVGDVLDLRILSRPDSMDTIRLSQPIENDSRSQTGRRTAWVQGQRYVSSVALRASPRLTSEL